MDHNLNQSENNSEIYITADVFRHPLWLITIYIIAYSSIFFIGLIGNFVVIVVILLNKNLQSVTNCYIVNLAIADLLVILWCIPPTLISHIYIPWYLGWFLCKTVAYVQGISVCASVYSLVAISVDRFLAIWSPLRIKGGKGLAKCIIALIWICSAGLMTPWALYFNTTKGIEGQDPNAEFCIEIWPDYLDANIFFLIANLFLGYIVPLIIILVCYLCIWFRVWKRYVPTDTSTTGSFTKSQSSHIELMHQRAKVSVLKMVIIIVLVFAISWLPLYITFTYIKFTDELSEGEMTFFTIATPISQWLSSSSSAVNPCLYAFINKKFRRVLFLRIEKIRNNNSTSSSNKKMAHVILENKAHNGSGNGIRNELVDTFV